MGSTKGTYHKERSFTSNYFIFLKILFQESLIKSWFDVSTTQVIFIIFISAGVSFKGAFSLWISLMIVQLITFNVNRINCVQDALKRSWSLTTKQDVVTTSGKWRRIYDVLKTSDLRRLEDVQFATSWKRLIYNVYRTCNLRRLEDVWFTLSWRRPIYDMLKTSYLWRLEDVWFMTSWRRL